MYTSFWQVSHIYTHYTYIYIDFYMRDAREFANTQFRMCVCVCVLYVPFGSHTYKHIGNIMSKTIIINDDISYFYMFFSLKKNLSIQYLGKKILANQTGHIKMTWEKINSLMVILCLVFFKKIFDDIFRWFWLVTIIEIVYYDGKA